MAGPRAGQRRVAGLPGQHARRRPGRPPSPSPTWATRCCRPGSRPGRPGSRRAGRRRGGRPRPARTSSGRRGRSRAGAGPGRRRCRRWSTWTSGRQALEDRRPARGRATHPRSASAARRPVCHGRRRHEVVLRASATIRRRRGVQRAGGTGRPVISSHLAHAPGATSRSRPLSTRRRPPGLLRPARSATGRRRRRSTSRRSRRQPPRRAASTAPGGHGRDQQVGRGQRCRPSGTDAARPPSRVGQRHAGLGLRRGRGPSTGHLLGPESRRPPPAPSARSPRRRARCTRSGRRAVRRRTAQTRPPTSVLYTRGRRRSRTGVGRAGSAGESGRRSPRPSTATLSGMVRLSPRQLSSSPATKPAQLCLGAPRTGRSSSRQAELGVRGPVQHR